jgi:N-methylhydantoinase B/oxoprolinase/acetone carboxylase alpha subunit
MYRDSVEIDELKHPFRVETLGVVADSAGAGRFRGAPAREVTYAALENPVHMTTWFCDAYASWQKGGVENANGRLRRWLPRQIDIDKVSDQEIQDIVITANLTPRKCLGFKTPFQAILKDLGKDVQIRFT